MASINNEKKRIDFKIVPAVREDLPRMQEIERADWQRVYPNEKLGITAGLLSDFLDNSGKRNFMVIALSFGSPSSCFFVAKIDQHVIGYAIGKKDVRGASAPHGFLHHLYVDPAFWGHGVGGILLEKVLDWAGSDGDLVTTVVEYNTNAINFYKKYGFQESGRPVLEKMAILANGVRIPEIEMTRPGRSCSQA